MISDHNYQLLSLVIYIQGGCLIEQGSQEHEVVRLLLALRQGRPKQWQAEDGAEGAGDVAPADREGERRLRRQDEEVGCGRHGEELLRCRAAATAASGQLLEVRENSDLPCHHHK